MAELLSLFIGCGLVVSLLFSELFGFAAGGLVVPGYFALYMDRPVAVVVTMAVALVSFMIVKVVSGFAIIYGRRRTVLTILVAFIIGFAVRHLMGQHFEEHLEMTVIGYIIPGLIAIWMDRQGSVETLCTLTTAAVVTRLVMILVTGGDFLG
jgi:poly-gamma-glutamate biosynthesis protein PgsC/CapC